MANFISVAGSIITRLQFAGQNNTFVYCNNGLVWCNEDRLMKGSGEVGLTPVIFIFLIYWIHTMGELMVSPVGLSAVTKLAPARIVGMTMGAWFLYSGLSNFLAGVIARTTGAETIGGQMTNVAAAKAGYIEVYSQVGFIALGISVLMLLISPVITKMMHGAD